jgi:hypothetical protein
MMRPVSRPLPAGRSPSTGSLGRARPARTDGPRGGCRSGRSRRPGTSRRRRCRVTRNHASTVEKSSLNRPSQTSLCVPPLRTWLAPPWSYGPLMAKNRGWFVQRGWYTSGLSNPGAVLIGTVHRRPCAHRPSSGSGARRRNTRPSDRGPCSSPSSIPPRPCAARRSAARRSPPRARGTARRRTGRLPTPGMCRTKRASCPRPARRPTDCRWPAARPARSFPRRCPARRRPSRCRPPGSPRPRARSRPPAARRPRRPTADEHLRLTAAHGAGRDQDPIAGVREHRLHVTAPLGEEHALAAAVLAVEPHQG